MVSLLTQDTTAILIAALISLVALFLRAEVGTRSARRTRQLRQAADMLVLHASALETFLDDRAAPLDLKRLLIDVSDAMANPGVAQKLSEWALSRPFDRPFDSEDSRAIAAALAALRASRPELVESFDTAILTGVAGASLRWPESAASFEVAFPRLAVTPNRDATIAATAARFRPDVPFGVKPALSAMA